MDEDELSALADDIRARGQCEPIRRLPDSRIVDGRNRELACLIAGVEPQYEPVQLTERAIPAFVDSANLHRRHLTPEFRRERVRQLRTDGKSLRTIAKSVGVSEATVRSDLKSGAQFCAPESVRGADGQTYPAQRHEQPSLFNDEPAEEPRAGAEAAEGSRISQVGRSEVAPLLAGADVAPLLAKEARAAVAKARKVALPSAVRKRPASEAEILQLGVFRCYRLGIGVRATIRQAPSARGPRHPLQLQNV
jgi:ParB-like chromosome segregation protein Spo0J